VATEFFDQSGLNEKDMKLAAYTKELDLDQDTNFNDKVPLHRVGRQDCLTASKSGHRKLLYLQVMQ
jgi:hypothetical protein